MDKCVADALVFSHMFNHNKAAQKTGIERDIKAAASKVDNESAAALHKATEEQQRMQWRAQKRTRAR